MTETESTPITPEWPARLRDMMATYFSLDELKSLCLDVGADYDELGEGGKSQKIVALIRLMGEHGRIITLIEQCQELRPQIEWNTLRETAVTQPDLFILPPEKPAGGIQFAGDFRGATITIVDSAEAKDIENQPPEPGEPPYKGLQYFDEDDADHFFGREALTAQVIGRLADARFLAVIGASGSGKSSLVRAGIMPALQSGQRLADGSLPPTNSGQWVTVLMTPTAHPLDSLAAALLRDSDSITAVAELQTSLTQNPRTLTLAGRKLLANHSSPHLLLVIDQFEEIFTLCRQPEERQAFVDNLVTAVAPNDDNNITILLTLRADFYAQCAQYDSLRQLISQHQEYIGAMSREELARAIVQPAALGDWRIQEGLVEQMLDDVGEEPGALPLLSHALLETWARRRGRTMTLSGYKESGGVRGAIAQTAETIFQQRLTPEQRPIARMIFVRLTELGEVEGGETPDTRRRAAFSELITRATDPATLDVVLAILAEARLITTDILPPDETKVVEVAHEALIREWPTLRQWLDQDRADLIRHRQLTADVNDWLKLDKDSGALYRGARLKQMQGWLESFPEPLSLEEQAFLAASQTAVAKETAQQQRLARAKRLQNILIGVTAVLIFIIVGVAIYVASNPSRVAQQIEAGATLTPCLPQPMDGDFNIAVAEFVVLGLDGQVEGNNRAGRQLTERVYDDLNQSIGSEDGVQIWQDTLELRQQRCLTIGLAADDLTGVGSPAAVAEYVNADVLIYGTLQPVDDRAELQVKFFLAPQLGLDFSNMVGTYAFETAVPVFDIEDPGSEVDTVLEPQVEALARIARGFTNELLGRPEQALADFEQAAELVPKAEFTHFFVGQEYLFLAQSETEQAETYETAAFEAFSRAPENARAQIGLGGVHFIRAQRQLNEALEDDFAGEFEATLAKVGEDADLALILFRQVVAAGSQVERYGVPVDQIARLGEGISYRLLGELSFYQGDNEEAKTLIDDAIRTLETAAPALVAVNDHRLLAQTYQALGSVYEWQHFLLRQENSEEPDFEVLQQARDYYGQCLQLGEDFPFDTYMVAEIVEKLCRPSFEALPAS